VTVAMSSVKAVMAGLQVSEKKDVQFEFGNDEAWNRRVNLYTRVAIENCWL
jgi:hypothetical protein